jgi:hypothetical protein
MKLCYSEDEKYLFMAQLVTNHLLIYDISDLYHPFVLQSFNELNAVAYNTQVKKDLSYLFLLAGDGQKTIPLKSTINILVESYERGKEEMLNNSKPLLVGQIVDLYLTNIIDPIYFYIKSVFRYQYGKLKNLNDWINFDFFQ